MAEMIQAQIIMNGINMLDFHLNIRVQEAKTKGCHFSKIKTMFTKLLVGWC